MNMISEVDVEQGEESAEGNVQSAAGKALSAAQRARAERNRARAKALRDAQLQGRRTQQTAGPLDCGGGFVLEEEENEVPLAVAPSAPLVHRSVQPTCLECGMRFPQSFLLDTFDYNVCDACRDEEGAHGLITRTQAKSEFLLQDCDLDARPPPLRALTRPNPHRPRAAPMRLYLRAQLEQRALDVWGSKEGLEQEREIRTERRQRTESKAASRRLRALRMDVRSSLFANTRVTHEHTFGPEIYDEADDIYRRECACGHIETYEKM